MCVAYVIGTRTRSLKPTEGEPEKEVSKSLFDLAPGESRRLTIVSADNETKAFTRGKDGWRITQPTEMTADDYTVSDVADTVGLIQYVRLLASDAVSTDITGLDKPLWTVTLADANDVTRTLQVGRPVPLSGGRRTYVQLPGDERIYVVDVDLAAKLSLELNDFRSKNLLGISAPNLLALEVQGEENYKLVRAERGRWNIVEPVVAPAAQIPPRDLINALMGLRVSEFVDDAPKSLSPYDLAEGKHRLMIRLWSEGDEPTTAAADTQPAEADLAIIFGRVTGDKVYVRLSNAPGVYLVEASLLKRLQPALADLRDKELLDFDQTQVQRVEILQMTSTPPGRIDLVRKADKWRMAEPFVADVNLQAVGNLLDVMKKVKAESWIDDPESAAFVGMESPRRRVTLHIPMKRATQTLLVGGTSPSGEITFVKRPSDVSVAAVPTDEITALFAEVAGFWDLLLMELPPAQTVTELSVARDDGLYVLTRQADGAWSMIAPIVSNVDEDNVNTVIDAMEKLTATKVVEVGLNVSRTYTEADNAITVTVKTSGTTDGDSSDQKETHTHIVHVVKLAGRSYAWVDGREITPVGQFSLGLYENLAAEFRNRSVVRFDPNRVEGLRIIGADKIDLRREKGRWVYAADPLVKIDAAKVDSFLDTMKSLQAERFAAYGQVKPEKYSLTDLWFSVELILADGSTTIRLDVSNEGANVTSNKFAKITGTEGVFLLSANDLSKLGLTVGDFKE